MRRTARRWPAVLAGWTLLAGLAGPLWGQEKAAAPPDGKTLDRQITALLRVVIDTGADIHNGSPRQGIPYNPAGCYRLYRDTLITLRPLLSHHPDLQNAIDTGLAEVEQMPARSDREISEKAFGLRRVMDAIRASIGRPVAASLWERLGGEANVRQIVDDWVALAGPDPTVNFSRSGKVKLTDPKVAELKAGLVAYLSKVTGGPIQYQGKSMKDVHRRMEITNAEFDAALADLRKALEGRSIDPLVIQDVLKLLEQTRGDIVEVKQKPTEKGLEEKKPPEK
jgi:hemoglobin